MTIDFAKKNYSLFYETKYRNWGLAGYPAFAQNFVCRKSVSGKSGYSFLISNIYQMRHYLTISFRNLTKKFDQITSPVDMKKEK